MPGSLLIRAARAGKSTVAQLVTEDAPWAAVHLHTDSFYIWIRTGFVAPYLPEAARQNDVVLRVVAEAACGYARGGYDVVLDGVVRPWHRSAMPRSTRRRHDRARRRRVRRRGATPGADGGFAL